MTPTLILRGLAFVLGAACLGAQTPPVNLWPGKAPGEKPGAAKNDGTGKLSDYLVAGRPITIISNISDPNLEVFRPAKEMDTGAAVVVFPGGGYYILAIDHEGTEACEWLNSIGVTAVLVRYRVPRREGLAPYAAPLQDAQRAVGWVRSTPRTGALIPKGLA